MKISRRPGRQRASAPCRGIRNAGFLACLAFCLAAPTSRAQGLDVGGAISMGSWSANATRYLVRRPVCAWSSTSDALYRVVAEPDGNSGSFELLSDLGEQVRFEVRWRDNDVSSVWERLLPGLPSSRRYRFGNAKSCPGGATQVQIRLSKDDADRVPGGVYSRVLTFILVAE